MTSLYGCGGEKPEWRGQWFLFLFSHKAGVSPQGQGAEMILAGSPHLPAIRRLYRGKA